jgi:hypothetical protein
MTIYLNAKGERCNEDGKDVSIIEYYKERHASFRMLYGIRQAEEIPSMRIQRYDDLYQADRTLGAQSLMDFRDPADELPIS